MGTPAPTIIAGTRYGHLELTGVYLPGHYVENKRIYAQVECTCDCGSITYKQLGALKSGDTQSCSMKCSFYGPITHGLSRDGNGKMSKEYTAWFNMKETCENPNHISFKYAGARGITYSEQFETIEGFMEIMGKAPSKYHRFTRIDRDGDFEPGNVHWYLSDGRKKK